jgi:hypothetical protein
MVRAAEAGLSSLAIRRSVPSAAKIKIAQQRQALKRNRFSVHNFGA